MNAHMIKVWNDTVSKDDIVFFVGDFAMGKKEHHMEFLNALNGHIKFLFGNHDYWIRKKAKLNELPAHVEPLGDIYNLQVGKKTIVLCHFPLEEWEGMAGHTSGSVRNTIHCHGHVHGKLGKVTAPFRADAGWDVWGRPVPVEEIIELLNH